MKTLVLSTLLTVSLMGCYTGTFTYVPSGQPAEITNSIDLDKSKDSTWNQLVAGLSSNFFAINTMDNKSGFINLNFTGDPEKYVEGGELHYTVFDPNDKKQSYDFPATRASVTYQRATNNLHHEINRQIELRGTMNLLVSEVSATRSRLTVNIKYTLSLRETGETEYHETISFNSGQSAISSLDSAEYRSNGKLERAILDLVN